MISCPCGTGLGYHLCCGPLHVGSAIAPTAEALMRSRYSAFAHQNADYLLVTWHPKTRPARIRLDPAQTWTGLTILTARGGLLDTEGRVEFRASWSHTGNSGSQHEISRFLKQDGRWLYLAGVAC